MKIGYVVIGIALILAMTLLSACSFHVGVDWNGQTAVSNKTYTDKDKR